MRDEALGDDRPPKSDAAARRASRAAAAHRAGALPSHVVPSTVPSPVTTSASARRSSKPSQVEHELRAGRRARRRAPRTRRRARRPRRRPAGRGRRRARSSAASRALELRDLLRRRALLRPEHARRAALAEQRVAHVAGDARRHAGSQLRSASRSPAPPSTVAVPPRPTSSARRELGSRASSSPSPRLDARSGSSRARIERDRLGRLDDRRPVAAAAEPARDRAAPERVRARPPRASHRRASGESRRPSPRRRPRPAARPPSTPRPRSPPRARPRPRAARGRP